MAFQEIAYLEPLPYQSVHGSIRGYEMPTCYVVAAVVILFSLWKMSSSPLHPVPSHCYSLLQQAVRTPVAAMKTVAVQGFDQEMSKFAKWCGVSPTKFFSGIMGALDASQLSVSEKAKYTGKAKSLVGEDLEGKVIILIAPWCPHCKETCASLHQITDKHPHLKFIVLNAEVLEEEYVQTLLGGASLEFYPTVLINGAISTLNQLDTPSLSEPVINLKKDTLETSFTEEPSDPEFAWSFRSTLRSLPSPW